MSQLHGVLKKMALWRTRFTRPHPQLPKSLLQTLTPKSNFSEIPVRFLADLSPFFLTLSVLCTVESISFVNRSQANLFRPNDAKLQVCRGVCCFVSRKSNGLKAGRRFLVPAKMNFKRRKKLPALGGGAAHRLWLSYCVLGWLFGSAGAAFPLLLTSVWMKDYTSMARWPADGCGDGVGAVSPMSIGFVWSEDHKSGFSCHGHLGPLPLDCIYVTSSVTNRFFQKILLLVLPNRSTPFLKSLGLTNCNLSSFFCMSLNMKDLENKICVVDVFIPTQPTPRKGLMKTMGADLSAPHKTKSRKGSKPCSDGSLPEGLECPNDAVMDKWRGKDGKKSRRRIIDREKLKALQGREFRLQLQEDQKLKMKVEVMKLVVVIVSVGILGSTSAQPASTTTAFKCSSAGATCQGVVGYFLPNTTTLSALKRQFTVGSLRSILAVNNLPLTTKGSHKVEANQTVRIPFPCLCSNGTGISNKRPIYTVVPDDGLYHIAMDVYGGLVRYPEIAAVNDITDPNYLIKVGQPLWIPLPCSCDDVDGEKVVHYGHVVQEGSTVQQIAQEFDVPLDTLMKLNGIAQPKDLFATQVLDIPLRTCTSMVRNTSLDYPLLLSNDTYALTANDCVMCKCSSANNYTLRCEQSEVQSSKCSRIQCSGSGNLGLGNTSFSDCSSTTCSYEGYTAKGGVLADLTQVSTCPVNSTSPSPAGSTKSRASKTFDYNGRLALIAFLSTFISSILLIHS